VAKTAGVFGVSRYYAWDAREPCGRRKRDRELSRIIERIFKSRFRRYGSPRIGEELKGLGIRAGRKREERLMREMKLRARSGRKAAHTTDSSHRLPLAENILNRNFRASFSGEKRVSDITYLRTQEGRLYLTVIVDLFDQKVIGRSVSAELTVVQTYLALEMAVKNRPPREGLIFHYDRGIQYCSDEFRSLLKRLCPSVRRSMSREGNCRDNACAESFSRYWKRNLTFWKKEAA